MQQTTTTGEPRPPPSGWGTTKRKVSWKRKEKGIKRLMVDAAVANALLEDSVPVIAEDGHLSPIILDEVPDTGSGADTIASILGETEETDLSCMMQALPPKPEPPIGAIEDVDVFFKTSPRMGSSPRLDASLQVTDFTEV